MWTIYSHAQTINFPDFNFKNALVNTVCADTNNDNVADSVADFNNDGEIDMSEALLVDGLFINGQNITSLSGIENFSNLKTVYASYNSITTFNELSSLTGLTQLVCDNNQLVSLDVSNNVQLDYLVANDNQLASFDATNNLALTMLFLNRNQLIDLQLSQTNNWMSIFIADNQLSGEFIFTINTSYADVLDLSGNNFSEITINGSGLLYEFNCRDNPLTTLNIVDDLRVGYFFGSNTLVEQVDISVSEALYLYNNPNLRLVNIKDGQVLHTESLSGNTFQYFYLSDCPNLEYLCMDNNELSILENTIQNIPVFFTGTPINDVVYNTYCSFTPGGDVYYIQGETHLDGNANGCDADDTLVPNLNFNVSGGGATGTFTGASSGDYNIPVGEGMHSVSPIVEHPSYFSVSPTSVTVDFPDDGSLFTQDFCMTPNGSYDDLEVVIIPLEEARPGFDTDYQIVYKNKGTTTLSGDVQLNFDDDLMDFLLASPTVDSQLVGMLSWNYTNLQPFEERSIQLTMNLNTPVDSPPLNNNDVLEYTVTIYPIVGDGSEEDNISILNQTVVNSYDPNDITCLEGTSILTTDVGEYVHYLIRFENTGTASAINVVVKDVIDTNVLDINSIVSLHASHDYQMRVRDTNIVEFIFENINLPFDDATNDGHVLFKIKTVGSLVENDVFTNTAEIYFDFNAPIITNTAQTIVEDLLSVDDVFLSDISIYPNPVSDHLTIIATEEIDQIKLHDINGRDLLDLIPEAIGIETTIELNKFDSGLYLITVIFEEKEQTFKIIKN